MIKYRHGNLWRLTAAESSDPRPQLPLGDRFAYDPEHNILYCNFEGLTLSTPEQAADLAEHLDVRFRSIGQRVHVIVNYDNFEVLPPASAGFFAMIEHNGRYSLSRTRYSTNAFFRRRSVPNSPQPASTTASTAAPPKLGPTSQTTGAAPRRRRRQQPRH